MSPLQLQAPPIVDENMDSPPTCTQQELLFKQPLGTQCAREENEYYSPSPPPFSPLARGLTSCEQLLLTSALHPSSPPTTECTSYAIEDNSSTEGTSSTTADVHGSRSQWFGFKIVGDNIDKTVKPRHETMQHHSQNLHYFHSYTVQDRIDFSQLSDTPSQLDPSLYPSSVREGSGYETNH